MPLDRIDLHSHVLPPSLPDLRARFGTNGWVTLERTGPRTARMLQDGRVFREVDDRLWDPAVRLEDMDRDGVEVQVLSTVPVMFAYGAAAAEALELARTLNDHLAEVVRDRPDRFAGLGTIPLQDPDLAIAELRRCVEELGLAGIQIGTHAGPRELDDPGVVAVLTAAADLGAAVFVHPWDMLAPERMRGHWLPWLVGMPAELGLAIASLVLGGVFERLPTLRIAFAHGGGAYPAIAGRVQAGYDARPDLAATATTIPPREQLGRLVVDSLVHDTAYLRHLMDVLGPDRIALGTDYPFPLGETRPGEAIEAVTVAGSADRAGMLRGTAERFLGFPAGAAA